MDPFVHVDFTIAAAALLQYKFGEKPIGNYLKPKSAKRGIKTRLKNAVKTPFVLLASLSAVADLRLLAIGSLLPDLIDKPIGIFLFRNTFGNGRIFAHTGLFLLLISLIGFLRYKKTKRNGVLLLSFGTATHLILDFMWIEPKTLFWPFLGFSFSKGDESHWISDLFSTLIRHPLILIPEGIGLILTAWFFVYLMQNKMFWGFIRSGKLILPDHLYSK